MAKALKFRASKLDYVPSNQLTIDGFKAKFNTELLDDNRWVVMDSKIPWDDLVQVYTLGLKNSKTGAKGINPRVVLGALIIKHIENWSDRQTIQHIQENVYLQYFCGFSEFVNEPIFDPSSFVDFRKRLNLEAFEKINVIIAKVGLKQILPEDKVEKKSHHGKIIVDATACPQDITYPTDVKLLYASLRKSFDIIDILYDKKLHKTKPRTDRSKHRKAFLKIAQARSPKRGSIRNALKQLLTALAKNTKAIYSLLDKYDGIPKLVTIKNYKYLLVIQTVYDQQKKMFDQKTHSVEHRIVSIHQPHVRPIVRGKQNAKVEFGSKINISLVDGYSFLDEFSWEAFNEGKHLLPSIEKYKQRLGYYPEKVLADQIYCNRENRKLLKELGIMLVAKPLGRPKAGANPVSPGERNPVEGKFGQAKVKYGLNRILARLDITSKSWVACTFLVLNLVKLAWGNPLLLMVFGKKLTNDSKFGQHSPLLAQKWAA